MKIDLWYEEEYAYDVYKKFKLNDEAASYSFDFFNYFTGNAGDSLSEHKGKKFATYDNDSANNCGA